MAGEQHRQKDLFEQEEVGPQTPAPPGEGVRKCKSCTRPADEPTKKLCSICRKRSRATSLGRQNRLVAEGKCCTCGKPREEGTVRYCDACRAYYSLRNKERAKNRAAVKLCQRCEKPNASRSLHCQDCRDFMRERGKRIREEAKAKGLCMQCDNRLDGPQSICSDCRRRLTQQSNALKKKAFALYGGCCNCCGEMELSFLTIDHVNDDGGEQRRAKKHPSTGKNLYRWIISHGKQEDQQVLCWSCQWGKRIGNGICPHKTRGVMNSDGEGI